MTKQELIKKYQEIILKTNGGNNDYVGALCQIGNAINELDEPDKQFLELEQYKKWKGILGSKLAQELLNFLMCNYFTEEERVESIADLSE